jgi:hypothetical protein
LIVSYPFTDSALVPQCLAEVTDVQRDVDQQGGRDTAELDRQVPLCRTSAMMNSLANGIAFTTRFSSCNGA